jgi:hypothetical protein
MNILVHIPFGKKSKGENVLYFRIGQSHNDYQLTELVELEFRRKLISEILQWPDFTTT